MVMYSPAATRSSGNEGFSRYAIVARAGREAETLLADSGYFSQANVEACAAAGIEPLIPQGRQTHYPPLSERFANVPPAPGHPTPLATLAHPLDTTAGQK